jgi:hypothetical protein
MANDLQVVSPGYVQLSFQLQGGSIYTGKFWVITTQFSDVILGVPMLQQLPIKVVFNGQTIFTGTNMFEAVSEKPSQNVGQGIKFAGGTSEQQKIVTTVLLKYQSSFFEWSGRYGIFQNYPANLELIDTVPVKRKPYRLSPDQQCAADEILKEYKKRALVEECVSPYAAATFLVPKKCAPGDPAIKAYRFVEDYRPLNAKLKDWQQPQPVVQDLLDQLGPSVAFFCTLDLKQGYHHVPIAPADRQVTAFVTPRHQYQYKVLPYGLKTAPRIFQHTMQSILAPCLGKSCLVYIDDVIVYGATFQQISG